MMSQKETVYHYIKLIKCGQMENPIQLDKAERLRLVKWVTNSMRVGATVLNNKVMMTKPGELERYAKGLINNWLRKDSRLNGGDESIVWGKQMVAPTQGISERFTKAMADKKECKCTINEIMNKGCVCGAITRHDPDAGWR